MASRDNSMIPMSTTTSNHFTFPSLAFWLFLLSLSSLIPSIAIGKEESLRQKEKKILDDIIGNVDYDPRIRPSGSNATESDADPPAIVMVNLLVRSIARIDDVTMEYSIQITFREEWNDERLQYDDLNGRIHFLVLTDPEKIWKPDLFFSNEKDGHTHNIIMPNVLLRIFPNGNVLYSIRISLTLFCPMDLKYYPLDIQTCKIKMASYGYTTEDLVFQWKGGKPVQVNPENLNLPRFTLANHTTEYCNSKTNTGEYSCVQVNLRFRREFSYYLIQIYIPCIMLVIVSWVSFWLDPNSIPARVSLGVTTLLTMATQISGINASLPPVSYTKAIDVWTGVCLTFVFGALLEFALVNYASRSDAHRAALKKKQEQQQQQEIQQVTAASVNQQNQGWDLEAGFNMDGMDGPAAYVMKPVLRGGQRRNPSFAPLVGSANPLLGPNHRPATPAMPNHGLGMAAQVVPQPLTQKLRSCEVHAAHNNQNICQKWLSSFPTRSKRIDVVSRIFFPLMFGMFNIVYWTTYTMREDLRDLQ